MSRKDDVSWTNGNGLLARAQRSLIFRTLTRVKGNRRIAAKVLGIGERTLYRMIKRFRSIDRKPERVTCISCKGSGRCPDCSGNGYQKV